MDSWYVSLVDNEVDIKKEISIVTHFFANFDLFTRVLDHRL